MPSLSHDFLSPLSLSLSRFTGYSDDSDDVDGHGWYQKKCRSEASITQVESHRTELRFGRTLGLKFQPPFIYIGLRLGSGDRVPYRSRSCRYRYNSVYLRREGRDMEQLRKTNPPEFSREGEGFEAGEWLHQMSRRLDTLAIPDSRRMMLISYYLRGTTFEWWDSQRKNDLTWMSFELLFMQRFVPRSFQVDNAMQYLDLVQTPEMTMSQYTKKYEELYKYGKKYAPDDESKAEKYRDSLLLSICRMVIASRVRTYDEMVDMTLELERGERNSRQYWDVQKGRKASTISGSGGGSQKKPRTEFQGLRGQKVDQGKGSGPKDGKIVCFKCSREGHKKNQCTILGVKCYGCGMIGHKKHECPRGGRASEQSQAPGHQEAPEHPNFIGGTFLILNCWAKLLFDSEATTSFISASLARALSLKISPMRLMFTVDIPFGHFTSLEGVVLDYRLTKYHVLMDFWDRKVTLKLPEGGEIQITSLMTSAPRGDVATLTRVVEENMDVFPDELPGLPPKGEIDFTIELHPNVKPISIPPYRMAPA
ncbi:uncharacterized protein LOC119992751 [Tripterygium wilfordii]|uniref:uncharacterized protein LOC119992751 n=1 Tax=Tripterygium wilfordii TaxID=458696 RepID=UPI0018F82921|nr:uncharacterized protein LOC119992751 [Tripterygium wilfordii]